MGKGLGGSVRWRVYLYGLPAMGWGVFLMVTALSRSLGPIEDIDIENVRRPGQSVCGQARHLHRRG